MTELERLKVLSALKHGQNFISGRNTTAHEQKNMEDAIKIIETTEPVNVALANISKPICPKCKGGEYAETKKGFQCCYTDCRHEWQNV
jgi:hypothetical protein